MNNKTNRKTNPGYLVLLAVMLLTLPSIQLSAQRPKAGGKGPSRPAAASKPKSASKPAGVNKTSGANKPSGINKPSSDSRSSGINKPNNGGKGDRDLGGKGNDIKNSGNKTNNIGSNNNKVNIDNSKKNVNINVDKSTNVRVNNSRNTMVRRKVRPYPRPNMRMADEGTGVTILTIFTLTGHLYGNRCGIHGDFSSLL